MQYQSKLYIRAVSSQLKFKYSEKATHFCEIFTLLLSYVVPVTKVRWRFRKILWPSQNKYMNFNCSFWLSLISRVFFTMQQFIQLKTQIVFYPQNSQYDLTSFSLFTYLHVISYVMFSNYECPKYILVTAQTERRFRLDQIRFKYFYELYFLTQIL